VTLGWFGGKIPDLDHPARMISITPLEVAAVDMSRSRKVC
jgi:hypothetical protein